MRLNNVFHVLPELMKELNFRQVWLEMLMAIQESQQGGILCWGIYPVHYRLFSSTLDASSTHHLIDLQNQKCLQTFPKVPRGTKLPPLENHSYIGISPYSYTVCFCCIARMYRHCQMTVESQYPYTVIILMKIHFVFHCNI